MNFICYWHQPAFYLLDSPLVWTVPFQLPTMIENVSLYPITIYIPKGKESLVCHVNRVASRAFSSRAVFRLQMEFVRNNKGSGWEWNRDLIILIRLVCTYVVFYLGRPWLLSNQSQTQQMQLTFCIMYGLIIVCSWLYVHLKGGNLIYIVGVYPQ